MDRIRFPEYPHSKYIFCNFMGGKFTIWDFEEILLLNSVFAKLFIFEERNLTWYLYNKMPVFIQVTTLFSI